MGSSITQISAIDNSPSVGHESIRIVLEYNSSCIRLAEYGSAIPSVLSGRAAIPSELRGGSAMLSLRREDGPSACFL
jgi:hypothetical protein